MRGFAKLSAALLAVLVTAGAANAQEPTELNARAAAAAIRAGDLTSRALTDAAIARAEADSELNAFITLDSAGARAAAAAADGGAAEGPLAGVPIVVKDNINSADLPTTAGTPALRGFRPSVDAPVLRRLREAGAVLLGKTNMHELAFGITSINTGYGPVGNAYAPDRFAGGSSGGTAVAIARRMVPAGLGTDTGGSVRIPAALNGIAGLRPTVGRYPQSGIVPISHTRDTAGPMARTVEDLVLLDGIITGAPTEMEPAELDGLRLGVPAAFNEGVDTETARVMQDALAQLEEAGVVLVPLDLAEVMELNAKVGFPVALWEVRRDLPSFLQAHRAGVTIQDIARGIASPDVKFVFDNLVLGEDAIPGAAYGAAIGQFRPELQLAYHQAFTENDIEALVFPTTPLPAQPIEGSIETVMLNGEEVPTFQTFIRNTDPGSNAGLPGLTVPAGLTDEGLPVGLELDGPSFSDRRLLAIGLAVERLLGRLPPPE